MSPLYHRPYVQFGVAPSDRAASLSRRRITVLLSASSLIRLFYKDKSCRNVSVAAAAKYDAPPEIVAATTEVRFHFAANRHGAAGRGT